MELTPVLLAFTPAVAAAMVALTWGFCCRQGSQQGAGRACVDSNGQGQAVHSQGALGSGVQVLLPHVAAALLLCRQLFVARMCRDAGLGYKFYATPALGYG
jgi:hypothetical protein